MDDLLQEFLTESNENISELDVQLVRFEQNPNDEKLLSSIFRLVHTIKGTCGFLGLPRLEAVAHAGENVLGKIRDGELEVNSEAISLILACIDAIKAILGSLEAIEAEPDGDDSELIKNLNGLLEDDTASAAADAPEAEQDSPAGDSSLFEQLGGAAAIATAVDSFYEKVFADKKLAPFFEGIDTGHLHQMQEAFLTMALGGPNNYSGADLGTAHAGLIDKGLKDVHFDAVAGHLRVTLEELGVSEELLIEVLTIVEGTRADVLGLNAPKSANEAKPQAADKPVEQVPQQVAANTGPSIANQTIRVNIDLLENLMNLVSELVLTRNQLLQMVRGQTDSEFNEPFQRLSHATTELQEGVMKTRMQPIGNAWNKLPRIVRDLSLDLDKKIELKMLGADTELDRQVLELIKDPLTHMVRNSGDHGIESPADRKAIGKSETGTITLKAYHEGGHIIIEIADDGRGIAIDKVKAKAIANGLATEAEIEDMSDVRIQQFIFKAGFSTAEQVTNVSGRGVGMDVVCSNIEKIGGNVELKSVEGKGSTFIIKIPLTLAIVSALIVQSAGERFAIPQISVVELVRASANSEHTIESLNGTPVLRLRDHLLPLVSLRKLLKIDDKKGSQVAGSEGKFKDSELGEGGKETYIVVTNVGSYSLGIVVDKVYDTEEIVVKPVAPILRNIGLYAGNTILGDGCVVMILDPNGIAAASGQSAVTEDVVAETKTSQVAKGDERFAILIFHAENDSPKAVPLSLVARLEEIECEDIETSNGNPMVQYRGQLMPLVTITPGTKLKTEGRQPVIVFTDQDRSMGLVVDKILDIVEDRMKVELSSDQPGMLGSAVIDGKATDVIDAGYYLSIAQKDWYGSGANQAAFGSDSSRRVLLVDDSPFFRNLLTPLLSVAGYQVTTVESADEALSLRDSGQEFDIIVSDIEMPGMSGFEFAETIKGDGSWKDTPLVALTSHATPKDFERGRSAGFDDYVAKFDREALLNALVETLTNSGEAA